MASTAVQFLEALLQDRRLGSTLPGPAVPPRFVPTGLEAFDQALGGGWRMGALSELAGRQAAGRSHLVMRTLARVMADGQVAALVDAIDRFDPVSAVAAGVDLERLLWVRGASILAGQSRPTVVDRVIKQAVRAFDLILRARGFAVVVLDLRGIPPRRLQALPAVTWLRLTQVIEAEDTVGLLLADAPLARSARGASVLVDGRAVWVGTSAQSRRLAGFSSTWTVRSAVGTSGPRQGPALTPIIPASGRRFDTEGESAGCATEDEPPGCATEGEPPGCATEGEPSGCATEGEPSGSPI